MDAHEQTREQQVWQRVLSPAMEQPRNDLRSLQMEAMELAAVCRYLQGVLTGKQRELLRQLLEGENANISSLKGLMLLSGQREEVLKIWNPAKEPPRKLLEKCYFKARRCMVDYMGRSAEPEFGVVFRSLADREGRHCAILAELLGSLKQG